MISVLAESLRFLGRRPKVFLPKGLSSVVGSLFLLGVVSGALSPLEGLALLLPVSIIGMFSTLMVASMVRSGNDGLRRAAAETLHSWREGLLTVLVLLTVSLVVSLPGSIGLALYLVEGYLIAAVAGIGASVVLAVLFSSAAYFLPITVLEESSFSESLRNSYTGFRSRTREVFWLVLVSFALLGVVWAAEGALEGLGAAGFIAGRGLSSAVNTYVFVVSPKAYEG